MKNGYLLVFLLFLIGRMAAQDQHFTQFYASPLTLNPALTGSFEGKYRVSLIYRDQWRKVLDAPYQTFSAAADFRYPLGRRQKRIRDAFGVGVLFYNDRAAQINFSTNQIMISGALHKSLSPENNQFLSLGAQLGMVQRNINYDQLTFNDEFNGSDGYTLPTGETLPENNFAFGDYQVGLNYTYSPDRALGVYAGVAMHHISEPEVSFFYRSGQDGEIDERLSSKLYRKYSAHLSLRVPFGSTTSFSPRALFYTQGPHAAITTGANFRFLLSDISGTALHVGAWARPVRDEKQGFMLDAVIGLVGLELSNFLFGFSYDANGSNLSFNQRSRGAFEISVAYLGEYEDETVLCPKF